MFLLLGCVHNVDIFITGAEIAPTMANGAAWDGPDNVPVEARGLFDAALSHVDPSGQLFAAIGGAIDSATKPDAAGTAVLSPGLEMDPSTVLLPVVNDSLSPAWAELPVSRFGGVALNGKTVVRITLVDKDLQTDDPIGTIELSASDLMKAEHSDGALVVDVSAQTSGQLKSVSVVVRESRSGE